MKPRVLIVGTVPYNKKSTSRAFESYFGGWEKENLAQIFSNTKKPVKGHCESLYQITDKMLLQRRISKTIKTGIIFRYQDLPEEWTDTSLELKSLFYTKMYRIGSCHTPLTHLLRKWIWKKKYWCSDQFNHWLEEFQPECVFLSFSDDFFISEIALYVAEKYKIPIVSSIGDDYYFNIRFSLSPFYYIYKHAYRKLIKRVFAHNGSAVYIDNKIRDKYNSVFPLYGETVYLASTQIRKKFHPINREHPIISYFGNIGAGRNESLNQIGLVLGLINPEYVLNIYSNETDTKLIKIFSNNPNVRFLGSIAYAEVKNKISESDIVVLVEGFSQSDVDKTRYSLSTKAADSLTSGCNILVYGSADCGLIEYMANTESAAVCTDKMKLEECIRHFINNFDFQKNNYEKASIISVQNHSLNNSIAIFEKVVKRVMQENQK